MKVSEMQLADLIKFKDLEFMKSNYIDKDGDFWEIEGDFIDWQENVDNLLIKYVELETIRENEINGFVPVQQITESYNVNIENLDFNWAIDRVLTKEENPEYFL